MATRSRIGLLLEDNSILSVYHHWDGSPSTLGKKLAKDYNSKERVSELIDGGDISTCMARSTWDDVPTEKEIVLYYSERGENEVEPTLAKDDFAFVQQTSNCNGEFAYVFNTVTNQWTCYDVNAGEFVNLYEEAVAA